MRSLLKKSVFSLISFGTALNVFSQQIVLKDPAGDDNGPGNYAYPTDAVYKKGSFDMTELTLHKSSPGKLTISVTVNAALEDAWKYGTGFSLQMVFIFIDTDNKQGSGFTKAPPGLNIQFEAKNAWDKCIILSPQQPQRIKKEIEVKAPDMAAGFLIPARTKGIGNKIHAVVEWPDEIDITQCSFQAVMQCNDGFPKGMDLLTKPVNEYEGQHRFGGGTDYDCDPHVLDLFAGKAKGEEQEKKAQYTMLAYTCAEDGSPKKIATLTMIKPTP